MRWKPFPERTSLRWQLFALLLPVLGLITVAGLWTTRRDALDAANAAYDRSLLGAAKSIAENISTASGGLSVELPYRMFEFFELTANGPVHFRVATTDGLVEIGSADLPQAPGALKVEVPVFYDATYFGESVRLVAYLVDIDQAVSPSAARRLLVQVAEGTQSRQAFTRRFVGRAAARDALVFVATLASAALVVAFALRPLARLAAQVRARRSDDLTPLDGGRLPTEVEPLVQAVNQQMLRTQLLAEQQRRFVDDASHQLRTHLTTLQIQSDYAVAQTDPEPVHQALGALREELLRATHTTNQLLALARSDTATLSLRVFELESLVREVALSQMPQARAKGIDLGVRSSGPGTPAVGDRELLREALLNLLANAVRCTPEQGEVTLVSSDDALGWSLSVTDSGPGLAAAELAAAGTRFLRGPRQSAGSGSGLGLAISRAIAERHGGVLRLERPDSGTGLLASIWWPRAAMQGGAR